MKLVNEAEAVRLIPAGATVATQGFTMFAHPEALTAALEKRFLDEGAPRDLTVMFSAAIGDGDKKGMNHLAHDGLVRRVIAAGWRASPRLADLAKDEKLEAYGWPQGAIAQLYRATAAGQPGILTRIGLNTFVDPAHGGGRLNASAREELVKRMNVGGADYLFFPSIPVDCALLRGTTADADGNISMEHEAFPMDALSIAQATRASGGIVIVQVKRLCATGELDPLKVQIPGLLVDYVVVTADPAQHWMGVAEEYNPAFSGETRAVLKELDPLPLTPDKVVQRRAFLELRDLTRPIVNLGVGIPSGVGQIANEEGKHDLVFTVESGVIGGVPAAARSFGASWNPAAIIPQSAQFDFYDGGGLDVTCLGMAELDVAGNVNVSKFAGRINGIGGFINISQTARKVIFVGSFNTGGTKLAIGDKGLRVETEGRIRKIVPNVEHLSFNAGFAVESGQSVLYITERAVFTVRDGKLTVIEIAPGLDPKRDIVEHLPDGVVIASDCRTMDLKLFAQTSMARA